MLKEPQGTIAQLHAKNTRIQEGTRDDDVEHIAKLMSDGADYISARRPSAFVFENVASITFKKHRPSFYGILAKLESIRDDDGARVYQTEWRVLDTKIHGGLPQSRPRVYIVGALHKRQEHPIFWPPDIGATALSRFLDKADEAPLSSWPTVSDIGDGTVVDKLRSGIRHILAHGGHPFRDTWVINSNATKPSRSSVTKDSCPRITTTRASTRAYYLTNRGRLVTTAEMLRLHGINPKRLRMPPDVLESEFAAIVGRTTAVPVLARVTLRLCKALGFVPKLAQAGLDYACGSAV